MDWDHGEVGYFLEGDVYLGGGVFVLNSEGEFPAFPDGAISELEEIFFKFDLGAHGVGLELDDHGVVSLRGEHDTVLVDILRFELGAVLLVVDGAFLVGWGQGVGGCVDLIPVVDLGPADEVHLQLLEGLDYCTFGLHEHDSFALLAADLIGGLHVDELLGGDEVAFAEDGAIRHPLGTVVDHKGSEDALLTHEHRSEVEAGALVAFGVDYVAGVVNRGGVDVDGVLDQDGLGLQADRPLEDARLLGLVFDCEKGLLALVNFEVFGLDHQHGAVVVGELNGPGGLSVVFDGDLFDMLLADLEEAHIDEGFEENLALHLVDPDGQVDGNAVLADDLDDLGLVFEFLALVLDLGGGGEAGGDFGLHGVDDFEVGVEGLAEADAFGPVGEVPDFDCYFVVLIDFDVLEDHFCGDDLEALGVDGVGFGVPL